MKTCKLEIIEEHRVLFKMATDGVSVADPLSATFPKPDQESMSWTHGFKRSRKNNYHDLKALFGERLHDRRSKKEDLNLSAHVCWKTVGPCTSNYSRDLRAPPDNETRQENRIAEVINVKFLTSSHKNLTDLQEMKSLEDLSEGAKLVDIENTKPDFTEVYAYAEKSANHFIRKTARHLPKDQQEEIFQDAMLRTWQAYQNLDASRGWKSFVQLHCRGACLDYLKGGNGNIEDGFVSEGSFDGLKTRVEVQSQKDEGSVLSVEDTAAFFGVFHGHDIEPDRFSPNWDLLSRMAGQDEELHIVAKVLLGRTQEEIAQEFSSTLGVTISRERISQRIYELFESFDSVEKLYDKWTRQSIFALGLSSYYHEPAVDLGIGYDLKYFDLHDPDSFRKVRSYYRPTLFDFAEIAGETNPANEMAI